jgi:hypothetical protein
MRADVVEGADHIVFTSHDDDRGIQEFQFAREVAAGPRYSLHAPHVEPGLLEDVLAFFLVELLRNTVFERHRAAAQFGIRIRSVPACRLGDEDLLTHSGRP